MSLWRLPINILDLKTDIKFYQRYTYGMEKFNLSKALIRRIHYYFLMPIINKLIFKYRITL